MAKLVCIHENLALAKVARGVRASVEEDHAIQPVGDIVGVFEDSHVFSPLEESEFEIIDIQGFTRQELIDALPLPQMGVDIDGNDAWLDASDGLWKRLSKRPKFKLSKANIKSNDISKLASSSISIADKIAILQTLKNRIADYPENFITVVVQT